MIFTKSAVPLVTESFALAKDSFTLESVFGIQSSSESLFAFCPDILAFPVLPTSFPIESFPDFPSVMTPHESFPVSLDSIPEDAPNGSVSTETVALAEIETTISTVPVIDGKEPVVYPVGFLSYPLVRFVPLTQELTAPPMPEYTVAEFEGPVSIHLTSTTAPMEDVEETF